MHESIITDPWREIVGATELFFINLNVELLLKNLSPKLEKFFLLFF